MAVRLRVIISVFLLTGAVLVASSVLAYWFGNRVLHAQAREELRRNVLFQLSDLTSIVKDAETGQRGFIITGDENYLAPYNNALAELPRAIEKLKSMPRIDITERDVNGVVGLIERKM